MELQEIELSGKLLVSINTLQPADDELMHRIPKLSIENPVLQPTVSRSINEVSTST
jgi:hypothetical protein